MAESQRPTEEGSTLENTMTTKMPMLRTAFSRGTAPWYTWQGGPCADYEYEWSLCAARVGERKLAEACKVFHDDLMECAFKIKQNKRYRAMQIERERQNKPFVKAPEPDSFRIWEKKDN